MPEAATIGVYGSLPSGSSKRCARPTSRQLLDVRQRRGVRGPEYAWANSRRLQAALAEAGIEYRHHRELAPTTELRHLQYTEDDRLGVGQAHPHRAGARVCGALHARDPRPGRPGADRGRDAGAGRAALFCVERDPEACHRSLIAARLTERHGVPVIHLRP